MAMSRPLHRSNKIIGSLFVYGYVGVKLNRFEVGRPLTTKCLNLDCQVSLRYFFSRDSVNPRYDSVTSTVVPHLWEKTSVTSFTSFWYHVVITKSLNRRATRWKSFVFGKIKFFSTVTELGCQFVNDSVFISFLSEQNILMIASILSQKYLNYGKLRIIFRKNDIY